MMLYIAVHDSNIGTVALGLFQTPSTRMLSATGKSEVMAGCFSASDITKLSLPSIYRLLAVDVVFAV